MSDSDDDSANIPDVTNPGSTGTQNQALEGEIVLPTTKNTLPVGQFDRAVGRIVESRSRGISSDVSALIYGRLSDQTDDLTRQVKRNDALSETLERLRSELSDAQRCLAVEQEKRVNATNQNRVFAAILIIAGLTSSFAFKLSGGEFSDASWLMLAVSGALYILGIFGKSIFDKAARK